MNLDPEIMKEVFEIVECSCALRNELKLKYREKFKNREKFLLLGMALKQHLLLALASGTVYPVTLKSVCCLWKICKLCLQRIRYVLIADKTLNYLL